MEYKVLYSIWDKVKYVSNEKVMTIIGYQIFGDVVKYMSLDSEWVNNISFAIELEDVGERRGIGFTVSKC
jgi:hypothetical protein